MPFIKRVHIKIFKNTFNGRHIAIIKNVLFD